MGGAFCLERSLWSQKQENKRHLITPCRKEKGLGFGSAAVEFRGLYESEEMLVIYLIPPSPVPPTAPPLLSPQPLLVLLAPRLSAQPQA